MKTATQMTLTTESHALFMELAGSAGDWNGQPVVDVSREQRGNLTDLKKVGLLTTFKSDGCQFADFTASGIAYAAQHGITITTN